jgi:hypothetical protein
MPKLVKIISSSSKNQSKSNTNEPTNIIRPSRKYLGWDIGIKNLAYCLIEEASSITPNAVLFGTNYYSILEWEVINLVSQVNENMSADGTITSLHTDEINCCYQINIDKKCKAKAKMVSSNISCNTSYVGYCANHAKKIETGKLVSLANKKCTVKDCKTKGKFCLKNHHYLLYCGKHQKELVKNNKHQENDFLTIQTSKKSSTIGLTELGKAIVSELDKRPHLLDGNIVLLENQPVLKNPTMKSIQMFLYSYFLMKGMMSGNKTVNEILCYTASNKIEIKKLLPDEARKKLDETIAKIKNGYKQNKDTAIYLAEYYIANNGKWGNYWKNNKKQDDLADSLLMTIHYLEKPKLKTIKN